MSTARVAIIVPVKPFAAAKTRLGGVLSAEERAVLSAAMLEDVLGAAVGIETFVVTGEPAAGPIAARHGARIVAEPDGAGLNAAIAAGIDAAMAERNAGAIVVPSDLPQIAPRTLAEAIARLRAAPAAAVIARAVADGGTNLLGLHPARLVRPAFGPESFARHHAALVAAGTPPIVLLGADTGHDIDRPADLAHFLRLGTATRAGALLRRLGVAERLAAPEPALAGEAS